MKVPGTAFTVVPPEQHPNLIQGTRPRRVWRLVETKAEPVTMATHYVIFR